MKSYNSTSDLPSKLAVFPLTGAVLFPQTQLPLNIFEPRYIQMIDEVLSSPNRIMGMIQPSLSKDDPNSKNLKKVGCAGRISSFSETGDGRYLVTLTGSQTLTNKTLTTPTIGDMSNCTLTNAFSAGHILQATKRTSSFQHQQTSNNQKSFPGVAYEQLTTIGASSWFLAYYSCQTGTQGTGSWTGGHSYRTSTDGGSSWSAWTDPGTSSYSYNSSVSDFRRGKFWHTLISPGLAAGKLVQIRAYCESLHSNTAGFDGPKYETFWEIKA